MGDIDDVLHACHRPPGNCCISLLEKTSDVDKMLSAVSDLLTIDVKMAVFRCLQVA